MIFFIDCRDHPPPPPPGLAIQWGPVADVGFVGKIGNSVVITEKFPQRIQSVKSTFDYMLSQSSSSVVSSYVHNDRSSAVDAGEETVAQKIARAVGKVLGDTPCLLIWLFLCHCC